MPRPPRSTLFPYTTLFRSLPTSAGLGHLQNHHNLRFYLIHAQAEDKLQGLDFHVIPAPRKEQGHKEQAEHGEKAPPHEPRPPRPCRRWRSLEARYLGRRVICHQGTRSRVSLMSWGTSVVMVER